MTENIAFKITINDEYIGTAEIKEGVITAIADCVKRKEQNREELKLNLVGLEYDAEDSYHLRWLENLPLNVGDKIEIEILQANLRDEPIKKYRTDPDLVEREERKYYERLKQKYGD